MTEGKRPDQIDAEAAQREQQAIDTAQGPGPVLDQDRPDAMPLFDENERAAGDVQSAVDPAEFAELGQHTGDQLDQIRSIDESEQGIAERAAEVRPVATNDIGSSDAER